MPRVHYVAYGSNLHPLRLIERVPSAQELGVVELPGCQLTFHKRSIDGSGKCHLHSDQKANHKVYGVLYEFDSEEKQRLDELEGLNQGYSEQTNQFVLREETYSAYLYVTQPSHIDSNLIPYHWYKKIVLLGARFHTFPDDYINYIESIPSKDDSNFNQVREKEMLIQRMLEYSARNQKT
ncbi:gamma-glutamylcyclotransferase family protein [Burkholderia ubonensis]|uniref:gamma-glutamylcyclotransferase family protein n=1 Tax=Burkholderia ubonensis TaxID=101571 RepID=UPI0015CE1987|nr:gamma-glutamylcyclotransferase family protein [Burkholderia ubonensis]